MVIAKWLNRILLCISGMALLAMAAQIGLAALSRSLFNAPIYGTIEISTYYYMVAVSLLPLGAVQVVKGHVIVEVFTQPLRVWARNVLDLFAAVFTAVYLGVLGWSCLQSAMHSFRIGEYVDLYAFNLVVWPARWILLIGVIGMLVTIAAQLITRNYIGDETNEVDEES